MPDTPMPSRIPLFPLPNAVLFPGMSLPLRVFEPRYKKMVDDVRETHKTIGMTLLKPGWEADYEGRPPVYETGCAGRMERCEPLEHGQWGVVLKGLTRFRILEEHGGQPYRIATIEPLPIELGDLAALETARQGVMAALGRASDGPAVLVMQNELPHDLFVDALSQSLPLDPIERQSLLDCDTVLARYTRLLEILEFKHMEQTYQRTKEQTLH